MPPPANRPSRGGCSVSALSGPGVWHSSFHVDVVWRWKQRTPPCGSHKHRGTAFVRTDDRAFRIQGGDRIRHRALEQTAEPGCFTFSPRAPAPGRLRPAPSPFCQRRVSLLRSRGSASECHTLLACAVDLQDSGRLEHKETPVQHQQSTVRNHQSCVGKQEGGLGIVSIECELKDKPVVGRSSPVFFLFFPSASSPARLHSSSHRRAGQHTISS